MKTILVTGSDGQLGLSLQNLIAENAGYSFLFTDISELDITNPAEVNSFFDTYTPAYCVNCAAYTAVDKAEDDIERCYSINAEGVRNLAIACREQRCTLIHISTDFVFDGEKETPYTETDLPRPLNVYGASKLLGEMHIKEHLVEAFIIRTSWVFSEYGKNFVKTILRLGREKTSIEVVDDQIGAPTYARDLAGFIIQIVETDNKNYGHYHFSNQGEVSWYGFACEILKNTNTNTVVLPRKTETLNALARRPRNSKLNLRKTEETFRLQIPCWKDSLQECLRNIDNPAIINGT